MSRKYSSVVIKQFRELDDWQLFKMIKRELIEEFDVQLSIEQIPNPFEILNEEDSKHQASKSWVRVDWVSLGIQMLRFLAREQELEC